MVYFYNPGSAFSEYAGSIHFKPEILNRTEEELRANGVLLSREDYEAMRPPEGKTARWRMDIAAQAITPEYRDLPKEWPETPVKAMIATIQAAMPDKAESAVYAAFFDFLQTLGYSEPPGADWIPGIVAREGDTLEFGGESFACLAGHITREALKPGASPEYWEVSGDANLPV